MKMDVFTLGPGRPPLLSCPRSLHMVTMPCGIFVPYCGLQNHTSGICTKGLLSSSCSTLFYPGLYYTYLISRQYKDLNHFKQSRSLVKAERVRVFCTAEEQKSGFLIDDNDIIALTKARIYQAIEGINRGIFGITSSKRREIEDLVVELEANNPTPNPTLNLEKVSGCWKLQYSTITILGSKRTKLGLRDFVNLGEFLQIIDVAEGKAVNIIKFSARGLNLLNGQLTIQASFSVSSLSKLNIKYDSSQINPEQLMNLFKKNYDLLLSIFNPEGWLEITYVDDMTMIGRDDKGNIFILERATNDNQLY